METKTGLMITISVFMAVLIGVILISPVANTVEEQLLIGNSSNETITAVNDTFVSLDNDLILTFVLYNYSNTSRVYTEHTDYTLDYTQGRINISNNTVQHSAGINTFYADYTYRMTALSADNASTGITRLVVVFFAIAIVAIAAMWFIGEFPDLKM